MNTTKNIKRSLFLVLCSFILSACLDTKTDFDVVNSKAVQAHYQPLEKQLILNDTDGGSSAGKQFALFFFTSTCGVCKEQIPILQTLAEESNIQIYGVLSGMRSRDKAEDFLQKNHINLPTFYQPNAVRYLSDLVGGVMGVPVVFFFNEKGQIKTRFLGLTPKSVLQRTITTS